MNVNTAPIIALMRRNNMNAEADALEKGEAVLGTICEATSSRQMEPTGAMLPGAMGAMLQKIDDLAKLLLGQQQAASHECTSCAKGSATTAQIGGLSPMWQPRGAFNPCYQDCAKMDACLLPYMEAAYSRTDDFSWFAQWLKDPIVIHLNKFVGGAGYVAGPGLPLAASQKTIFAMEDAQQLPFRGGGLKVDPKWSGAPTPSEVKVRLFTGPRGLTGLTSTSALAQMGNDLTLADFECKDDCFILEFPKLLGCVIGPIPADSRALYLELEAGAGLGAATLTSINFTVLKRGSDEYHKRCRQWGWDPEFGCA